MSDETLNHNQEERRADPPMESENNKNLTIDGDTQQQTEENNTTTVTTTEENGNEGITDENEKQVEEANDELMNPNEETKTVAYNNEIQTADDVANAGESNLEFEEDEEVFARKRRKRHSRKRRKSDENEDEEYQESDESSEDEHVETDEDSDKEKRSKSKKRSSKKRKTSKKSKRSMDKAIEGAEGVTGDEEDENYVAEPSESAANNDSILKEANEQFKQILEESKPKKTAQPGQLTQIDDEAARISDDLISRMIQAADIDRENLKNQKPAMAKIQMLPEIQKMTSKVYLQQPLLERGLLGVVSEWLRPLPNKQLPNLQLRSVLLDVLVQLPVQGSKRIVAKRSRYQEDRDEDGITKELLQKTPSIARTVKFLSSHPMETMENRKKASNLVERWSRLYYELPDDYSQLSIPIAEPDSPTTSSSKRADSVIARKRFSAEEEAEIKSSIRARIPQKASFDFQKRPQNKLDKKGKIITPPPSISTSSFSSPIQKTLAKKFQDLKRRTK